MQSLPQKISAVCYFIDSLKAAIFTLCFYWLNKFLHADVWHCILFFQISYVWFVLVRIINKMTAPSDQSDQSDPSDKSDKR